MIHKNQHWKVWVRIQGSIVTSLWTASSGGFPWICWRGGQFSPIPHPTTNIYAVFAILSGLCLTIVKSRSGNPLLLLVLSIAPSCPDFGTGYAELLYCSLEQFNGRKELLYPIFSGILANCWGWFIFFLFSIVINSHTFRYTYRLVSLTKYIHTRLQVHIEAGVLVAFVCLSPCCIWLPGSVDEIIF